MERGKEKKEDSVALDMNEGDGEVPREYLDAIRAALKEMTDGWTDQQLDDYAYGTGDGWDDYYFDGYSARNAVAEDMSYWEAE